MKAISTIFALSLLGSIAGAETNYPNLFPQDDCAPIREALKNLPAGGGEVVVPAGTYMCEGPIILDRDNLTLRGEGQVIIKLKPNTDSSVVIMGKIMDFPQAADKVYNVVVANLILDGNRHQQTPKSAQDKNPLECWKGDCYQPGVSLIRNNGISVRNVHNSKILNVTTKSATSGGVVTEHGVRNLLVDGLNSYDNHFDGYAGYETQGAIVRNTKLHHNQGAGVSIDLHYDNNLFENMEISDNGDLGTYQRESSGNTWRNVTVARNKKNGFYMSIVEKPESCPMNNTFENTTMIDNGWAGFFLGGACPGNRITGKTTITGNGKGNGDQACMHVPDIDVAIEGEVVCDKPTMIRK